MRSARGVLPDVENRGRGGRVAADRDGAHGLGRGPEDEGEADCEQNGAG